ncbi:MAG: hypothetical protein ACREME_08780 [Gemmatimonadales bacterium]
MPLGRLFLAWLPVAALFLLTPPIPPLSARPEIAWRATEALIVTLFAALWFDSLGAGGWWLLFLLVGLLVAMPRRLLLPYAAPDPAERRRWLTQAGLDVARYLGAGALLAWRLS